MFVIRVGSQLKEMAISYTTESLYQFVLLDREDGNIIARLIERCNGKNKDFLSLNSELFT